MKFLLKMPNFSRGESQGRKDRPSRCPGTILVKAMRSGPPGEEKISSFSKISREVEANFGPPGTLDQGSLMGPFYRSLLKSCGE